MNRQLIKTLILFIGLFSFSCGNEKNKESKKLAVDTISTNSATTPTIDTSIYLADIAESKYNGSILTIKFAKEILYKYFKSKGFCIESKINSSSSKADNNSDCVRFDTIYLMNLNNNKYLDAIVLYWLAPPHASGHCIQPHKAIIMDSNNGYKLSDEDFIPTNFAIDSVSLQSNNTMIFGYDYNCEENKVLRNLRIKINKK